MCGGAEIPTKTSDLTNDGDDGTKPFLTDHQDISGKINEPTSEGQNGYALLTDGNGGRTWGQVASDQYITSTSNDFSVSNKKLSLATSVTSKLSAIDSNGKISADDIKSGTNALSNADITEKLSRVDGTIDTSALSSVVGGCYIRKQGNVVNLVFHGLLGRDITAWTDAITTIPSGFRPSVELSTRDCLLNYGYVVRTSGAININATLTSGSEVTINITYII